MVNSGALQRPDVLTISVAKDFSRFPAGRYQTDGPFSGQKFRDELLVPALKAQSRVVVILDGAVGYGSSFIDEAFGGLVREHGFTLAKLEGKLQIVSEEDPSYETEAWDCIRTA